MLKMLREKIRLNRFAIMFIVIFAVGIFLRSYHFHDWLRFNPDQARDASIVSDALTKKSSLPLLGPKAGGTEFKLGPAFYYLEYVSAAVFGNYPDKIAYYDLLMSIATMPLLFIFLRQYFSRNLALMMFLIAAVSFFAVHYGRFAWNPNSMPFWTVLYLLSVIRLLNPEIKNKYLWSGVTGLSLGVAMQLHTLLLIILPVHVSIIFGFVLYKKMAMKKFFSIIFVIAIFVNIPQIISEYETHGKNTQSFFMAQKTKGERNSSFVESIQTALVCATQANGAIISSTGDDECTFLKLDRVLKKAVPSDLALLFFEILLSIGVTFGGWYLLIRKFFKEEELGRSVFLWTVGIFAMLYVLILIPVARDVSMRFFLGMLIVPFVFTALCLEYLGVVLRKKSVAALTLFMFIVVVINLATIRHGFEASFKSDSSAVTLGEAETLFSFIKNHSNGSEAIVDGKNGILFKVFRSLEYIANKNGFKLRQYSNKNKNVLDDKIFVITSSNGNKGEDDGEIFGDFSIREELLSNYK